MMITKRGSRSNAAFTMVEVALSMGVVVIAMVAILGILPAGMQTQKENHDQAIVGDEAALFMHAIRSGARGMDYLTNYVEEVFRVERQLDRTGKQLRAPVRQSMGTKFRNGEELVGSLLVPAIRRPILPYAKPSPYYRTNVQAIVRSMSGVATRNDRNDSTIFRYRLTTELNPVEPVPTHIDPTISTNTGIQFTNQLRFAGNSMANLHELRITLEWPLYEVNNEWRVGRNRKTYRTLLNGSVTNIGNYYFFEPNTYTNAAYALF